MTSLSVALEARGKAAPWPWQWIEYGDDLGCSYMADKDGEDLYAGDDARREETGKVAIAAPDALDWIAKALPYLKGIKEGMEAPLMVEPEKYDAIRSLIAQAEGTEKEGENDWM